MIGHNAFSTPIVLGNVPHHELTIENLLWELALRRIDDVSTAYDTVQKFMDRFPKDRPLNHDYEALSDLKIELVESLKGNAGLIRFCQEPLSGESKEQELAQAIIDKALYLTSPVVILEHDEHGDITFVGVAHGDEASQNIKQHRQEMYPDRFVTIRVSDDYVMPE